MYTTDSSSSVRCARAGLVSVETKGGQFVVPSRDLCYDTIETIKTIILSRTRSRVSQVSTSRSILFFLYNSSNPFRTTTVVLIARARTLFRFFVDCSCAMLTAWCRICQNVLRTAVQTHSSPRGPFVSVEDDKMNRCSWNLYALGAIIMCWLLADSVMVYVYVCLYFEWYSAA